MAKVVYRDLGYAALIHINRPERRNAYDLETARELRSAIERAAEERDIVILASAHGSFCAGGDIYEMHRALSEGRIKEHFNTLMRELDGIAKAMLLLPKVFIAAVDGPAFGGGLSMVLASDIRMGSERARFGTAVVSMGLSPDFALSYLLPRVVGESMALDMLLTGRILNAEEALEAGLLTRIVEGRRLLEEAKSLARKLAAQPRESLIMTRFLAKQSLGNPLGLQLRMERAVLMRLIEKPEYRERVRRFVERGG